MDINNVDSRLKPCTTTTTDAQYHTGSGSRSRSVTINRLTTLPVRILSLLPTKDAATACISSKRMMCVFPWTISLDFDNLPAISHCVGECYGIERFPTFVAFVDSVLQAHQSRYLTKFRLGVGPNCWNTTPQCHEYCKINCFADLNSTLIYKWINLPLARCGLRELDLRIHVREEGAVQLRSEIFICETLEVLKLNVNLGLDRVATMPSFRLPNVKVLAIFASVIPGYDFVTRLVSSCPSLEDLTLKTRWHCATSISISSPTLRRFTHGLWSDETQISMRDLVRIHAPNLEYFRYADDLAVQYSIGSMDSLVTADICIHGILMDNESVAIRQIMIGLIAPFSNVQQLVLDGNCIQELSYDEVKDQLPVFPKLKCLELCYYGEGSLDIVLQAFLNCSPLLEKLVFPTGIAELRDCDRDDELDVLEQQYCITDLPVIPPCCIYHLRRIEIKNYEATKREIELIQFFLRCALLLEEMVIFRSVFARADCGALGSALQNLPRASATCLIKVVEKKTT